MIDNHKNVARPPPKPKESPDENDLLRGEDITQSTVRVPVFREGVLGNFEVTEEKRSGPGEYGKPVILVGEEKAAGAISNREYGFNQVASDKVSLDRVIPDTRPEEWAIFIF